MSARRRTEAGRRGWPAGCKSWSRAFGGSLLIWVAMPAHTAETVLVPTASVWRYLEDGRDPGTAWTQPGFDDSGWRAGKAELGYGDAADGRPEATVLSFGPSPTNKFITTFFRHRFEVPAKLRFVSASLRLLRDDGAVVFLDGVEVERNNLPDGTIGYRTLASSFVAEPEEAVFESSVLDAALLTPGPHVVAVEVHQASASSSDLSFDLELKVSDRSTVLRGPCLQRMTPASVIVRWRTDSPTDTRAIYGATDGMLTNVVADFTLTNEHRVAISGLAPDTLYHYAVGTSGSLFAAGVDYWFRTAPTPGSPRPTRI